MIEGSPDAGICRDGQDGQQMLAVLPPNPFSGSIFLLCLHWWWWWSWNPGRRKDGKQEEEEERMLEE